MFGKKAAEIARLRQAASACEAHRPFVPLAEEISARVKALNIAAGPELENQLYAAGRLAHEIGTNTANSMVNQANGIVTAIANEADSEQVRTLMDTSATCEGLIQNILADILELDKQASLSEVSVKAEEFVAGAQEAVRLYENAPRHW